MPRYRLPRTRERRARQRATASSSTRHGFVALNMRSRLIHPVDQRWHPADFRFSFELLTELLGNPNRWLVLRVNDTDHMVASHLVERVLQQESSSLRSKPSSLEFRRDSPTDLETRPPFRIRKSYSSDESP